MVDVPFDFFWHIFPVNLWQQYLEESVRAKATVQPTAFFKTQGIHPESDEWPFFAAVEV
jgi:hypothetical protein